MAEGIETALSLASAFPQIQVKAALDKSGFKRLAPVTLNQHVVLCLDNDLKDWRDDKIITNATKQLANANKNIWVAMPEIVQNKKTDFNDVLQHEGIEKIINTIQ